MISLKVLVLKDLSGSPKTTFKQSKQNIPVIGFENEYFELIKSINLYKPYTDMVLPPHFELNGLFIYEDKSVDKEFDTFQKQFAKYFAQDIIDIHNEYDTKHYLSISFDGQIFLPFFPHPDIVDSFKSKNNKIFPVLNYPFYKLIQMLKLIESTFRIEFKDQTISMPSQNKVSQKNLIERDFHNCFRSLDFEYEKYELKCSSDLLNRKTDKFIFYRCLIEQMLFEKKLMITNYCITYSDMGYNKTDDWLNFLESWKKECWERFHKQYCYLKKISPDNPSKNNHHISSMEWLRQEII